jgi:hypothetical protein
MLSAGYFRIEGVPEDLQIQQAYRKKRKRCEENKKDDCLASPEDTGMHELKKSLERIMTLSAFALNKPQIQRFGGFRGMNY